MPHPCPLFHPHRLRKHSDGLEQIPHDDSSTTPVGRQPPQTLVVGDRAGPDDLLRLLHDRACRNASAEDSSPPKIYTQLLNPREHPDYERRAVRPPDWETFRNRTQLTSLRSFPIQGDRIVSYAEELELYTKTHELGDVIWPVYSMLFTKNLGELADEIQRRKLYLFDIWGYVPSAGPDGSGQQFKPSAEALKLFEAKLGPRWLGMDVGEQDGRYVGGYASQMYPTSASRLEQYFNFQRHFQRMTDDLGNKVAALLSLNFGHYFLKEGVYTLLGAETAQALPNSQVYYAFIRGAGKQYGVLWFGNASVYNRWGFKTYDGKGVDPYNYRYGPTQGTSLSLLKRLLYSHVLYNSAIVGFESGLFEGTKLSPIGRIQQAAGRWIKANGQPGRCSPPIAVMTDFLAGWTFPRHLYTGDVYRVWGNFPTSRRPFDRWRARPAIPGYRELLVLPRRVRLPHADPLRRRGRLSVERMRRLAAAALFAAGGGWRAFGRARNS